MVIEHFSNVLFMFIVNVSNIFFSPFENILCLLVYTNTINILFLEDLLGRALVTVNGNDFPFTDIHPTMLISVIVYWHHQRL